MSAEITPEQAHQIVKTVRFPGEKEVVTGVRLAGWSKEERMLIIRDQLPQMDVRIAAAVEIQRLWRGYNTRCKLSSILHQNMSLEAINTNSRYLQSRAELKDEERSEMMAGYYKKYVDEKTELGASGDIVSFEEFCARYIQNWWTRNRARRAGRVKGRMAVKSASSVSSLKSVHIVLPSEAAAPSASPSKVATATEGLSAGHSTSLLLSHPTQSQAAVRIQRAWRRHIDIQVFTYYKDLINFKLKGDPAMMLRCINPLESRLLDAAAGVHVRFRLAGDRFPPNIYYKIFTHRAVVDMCSNSPKDYTRPDAKLRPAAQVNNRSPGPRPGPDKSNWYKRIDNNGWRLVSDRTLAKQDNVTWETAQKKMEFHHSKLQRKQDLEKKRKRKKVEWMKKMYKEGMLKAKTHDASTVELIEGAAAGMMDAVESSGPDTVEDWEVDELLDWTNGLNFDDYTNGWKEVGTTAFSEQLLEERSKVQVSDSDPYELNLPIEIAPNAPSPSRVPSGFRVTSEISAI